MVYSGTTVLALRFNTSSPHALVLPIQMFSPVFGLYFHVICCHFHIPSRPCDILFFLTRSSYAPAFVCVVLCTAENYVCHAGIKKTKVTSISSRQFNLKFPSPVPGQVLWEVYFPPPPVVTLHFPLRRQNLFCRGGKSCSVK